MTAHVPPDNALARRLKRAITGDVLFDRFSRGRYSTDASIYQIEPVGVVIPSSEDDVRAAHAIAREAGVPLLARGGGTSQAGQTVGRALVIDYSKHHHRLVSVDAAARSCVVEPGIVLDELNRQLRPHGLFFPVDVSTSARATIGGMTANNSCGTRSLRYGIMRDNVAAIDATLADGRDVAFAELPAGLPSDALVRDLVALGRDNAAHIERAFPDVSRRVGGYLIDALAPSNRPVNLAHILIGSEGTLALTRRVTLKLSPIPANKALGLCHFPNFRAAMNAAQHIVRLGPVAVELVDRTLIELARDIAMFRPVMETYVRGKPDALLLVEFAEPEQVENLRRLDRLAELMGDLGFPGAVVKVADASEQKSIWEVRAAGLNIMMSMKSDGKPVSFIEDCAVPLEHLADYTERLTAVFQRHGTVGTWYAHASVGCLHVRPVLNLKLEADSRKMRAIAEEAFALVREYKGSHSGEHGDGLVRSEFHEQMYGRETVALFEAVKDRFDPSGLLNPGKIVRAPAMNDRSLFRYQPDYAVAERPAAFDWRALGYGGAAGGLQGAVEMCNNNGECRKLQGGAMCPSYRVTRDERDVTRGRANTLRLAISGQLGPDALAADDMAATMALCVSCKACRRECPTGVDMAKLKIEVQAARVARHGLTLHDRLVAYLPRYARFAGPFAALLNLPNRVPAIARLVERVAGFSAARPLPVWRKRYRPGLPSPLWGGVGGGGNLAADSSGRPPSQSLPHKWGGDASRAGVPASRAVALLADTFNAHFDPENLAAAEEVLTRLGYRVGTVAHPAGGRPICCGRTFLAAGLVEQAKTEAYRFLAAARPLLDAGVPIVGLEPSCLLTTRDEYQALGLGPDAARLGASTFLFEEFLAREVAAGRITGPIAQRSGKILLHGHCHQKAFDVMGPTEAALGLIGGAEVSTIESSCCGMAGAFGYGVETHATSMAMGELSLLPAVRAAAADTIIAADGFSCRHQIADGTGRQARHVAVILRDAMRGPPSMLGRAKA